MAPRVRGVTPRVSREAPQSADSPPSIPCRRRPAISRRRRGHPQSRTRGGGESSPRPAPTTAVPIQSLLAACRVSTRVRNGSRRRVRFSPPQAIHCLFCTPFSFADATPWVFCKYVKSVDGERNVQNPSVTGGKKIFGGKINIHVIRLNLFRNPHRAP